MKYIFFIIIYFLGWISASVFSANKCGDCRDEIIENIRKQNSCDRCKWYSESNENNGQCEQCCRNYENDYFEE